MFEELKNGFIKFITSRITVLAVILSVCALGLVWRLFDLQLVHGQEYMDSFQLMIKKERVVPGVRGNIYDRNGNLLAYNELTYSVTIEDVFDDGRGHNRNLNNSVNLMIDIVERNGDRIEDTFPISLDDNGMFVFELDGTRHLRFLADLYTDGPVEDLEYRDRIKTAQEVIDDLAVRYGVGDYADPEDADTFVPGLGYENDRLLKIIMIRYAMS
ncbi:MAG: penicillin-binding protein, partial [Butyrivibrio sp.]|nr:penicillin-binding protein [Butyrivibrio sp.]